MSPCRKIRQDGVKSIVFMASTAFKVEKLHLESAWIDFWKMHLR